MKLTSAVMWTSFSQSTHKSKTKTIMIRAEVDGPLVIRDKYGYSTMVQGKEVEKGRKRVLISFNLKQRESD